MKILSIYLSHTVVKFVFCDYIHFKQKQEGDRLNVKGLAVKENVVF